MATRGCWRRFEGGRALWPYRVLRTSRARTALRQAPSPETRMGVGGTNTQSCLPTDPCTPAYSHITRANPIARSRKHDVGFFETQEFNLLHSLSMFATGMQQRILRRRDPSSRSIRAGALIIYFSCANNIFFTKSRAMSWRRWSVKEL